MTAKMRTVALMAAMICFIVGVTAPTYYRAGNYHVFPKGDDSGDGSRHKPWRTICGAVIITHD